MTSKEDLEKKKEAKKQFAKKHFWTLTFTGVIIAQIFLWAWGQGGATELEKAKEPNKMLRTHITSVEPLTIDTGHMVYTIIGCGFGTSEEVGNGYDLDGDGKDGLISNFLDSVTGNVDFEENRDAKIALYFTVKLPEDAKSPRDDKEFNSTITVEDDKGEVGLGGYCNLEDKIIKAGKTYQAVYEADVFSDSQVFEFKIAGKKLKINEDQLYYIIR